MAVGVPSWAADVCVLACISHEGLEHRQILASLGILEPIPVHTEGWLSLGSQLYVDF